MAKKLKAVLVNDIENVGVESCKPHPRNSREHDEANLQGIMRSLGKYGQRTPLVVWRGYIIKGCGTQEAMLRLGWKQMSITRANHMREEDAVAYALADNKTSDLSEFDFAKTAENLRWLQEHKVDLLDTAFRDFELEPLLQAEFKPQEPPKEGSQKLTTEKLTLVFEAEESLPVRRAIVYAHEAGDAPRGASGKETIVAVCDMYVHMRTQQLPAIARPDWGLPAVPKMVKKKRKLKKG